MPDVNFKKNPTLYPKNIILSSQSVCVNIPEIHFKGGCVRQVFVVLTALFCSAGLVMASPLTINISGTITKTGGAAVEGATVTLAKIKGISATSDAQGQCRGIFPGRGKIKRKR